MTNATTSAKIDIDQCLADADTVEALFRTILGRSVGSEQFLKEVHNFNTIHYWVRRLVNSAEFRDRFCQRHELTRHSKDFIGDTNYRVPSLREYPMATPVIVAGSCMTESWKELLEDALPGIEIWHQLFNNASELEDIAAADLDRVAFQIVQIPLRSIVSEAEYFNLAAKDDPPGSLIKLFDTCVARLRRNLTASLKYNKISGLPVFVLNFAVPQANPLGRLLPKHQLTNACYFVRELNRELEQLILAEKSAYIVDYDEITASLGKRYILDDLTTHWNHGSFLGPTNTSNDISLTPYGSIPDIFEPKTRAATLAIFNECLYSYNIIAVPDKIKIVIFDLDGTLWRGVAADADEPDGRLTEGWPLGILEAATYLKRRGILIALASKNDPDVVKGIWNILYEKRFPLSNFVSTKISWNSKAEGVAAILSETNLLARNCLFVDDNPIEREQMKLSFPDISLLSGPIVTWRRALLWSTELQVAYITDETTSRTESVQTMVRREELRKDLDEQDYIQSLGIKVKIERIVDSGQKKYRRAHELLNKTNQFNTTGRRWEDRDLEKYLSNGGELLTVDVADRLSDYGLTAVLLKKGEECTQMVMSCRVFGLHVEFALFDFFIKASGPESAHTVLFNATGKNNLCVKFFENLALDLSKDFNPRINQPTEISLPTEYRVSQSLLNGVEVIVDQSLSGTPG